MRKGENKASKFNKEISLRAWLSCPECDKMVMLRMGRLPDRGFSL